MKRLITGILVLLVSATLLTGCISFKEFTDEELDRLSYSTGSVQVEE